MGKILEKRVMQVLNDANEPLSVNEILKGLSVSKLMGKNVKEILAKLCKVKSLGIRKSKDNLYWSEDNSKIIRAIVTRVNATFAFAKNFITGEEYFIPGRFIKGSLPGDNVIIKKIPSRGGTLLDAKICVIESFSEGVYFGRIRRVDEQVFMLDGNQINFGLKVIANDKKKIEDGVLVKVKIIYRGKDNGEHIAKLVSIIGNSENPQGCCQLLLQQRNIRQKFDEKTIVEAKYVSENDISCKEYDDRLDLRNEMIFTIDGNDSKDLDDAISIKKCENGNWELGVHIADVSYYVKAGGYLDEEAFYRGTSIYYADSVIPMLPEELSNGICSLNPNEDRLAFSCLMQLDENGKTNSFEFKKSVIRSRVKGVYEEINQILSENESEEISNKYKDVKDNILLMKQLADILSKKRFERGSLNLETPECKIKINEDKLDIYRSQRGESEVIIEEFMLKANEAAATFARLKKIPFIYRVHDNPPDEKFEFLCNVLSNLNIERPKNSKALELSKVLNSVEGTKLKFIVNNIILRSLSKAKYSSEHNTHYGLVLDNYSHFTSPIRRYPDLMIHRIMSQYLLNKNGDSVLGNFQNKVIKVALQSSFCEKNADEIERDCEDIYKAFYMSKHIGETFVGIVSSVAQHGIYVELSNTIEGLVKRESLPDGEYECINSIEFKNLKDNNFSIKVGDEVKIRIVKTDIFSGLIDFEFCG